MKVTANPNYIYILTFIIPLVVYSFGWSHLYPELSFNLMLFYIITAGLCLLTGFAINRMVKFTFKPIPVSRFNLAVIAGILVFFVIDCMYAGYIPLLSISSGDQEYIGGKSFGIPTIHVIMVTFTLFYSLYVFHQYISNKKKKLFFYFLLTIVPFVMLLQRSNIMYIVIGATFIYAVSLNKIKAKRIIALAVISVFSIYMFGYLGNIRSGKGDSTFIPRMSSVTEDFLKGPIPNEFYWGYLYIASPIASLQNNINVEQNVNADFLSFAVYELMPDFLTKNAHNYLDVKARFFHQLNDFLNVGTLYANSFSYLSWLGMALIFFYVMLLMNVYYLVSFKLGKYQVVALALMFNLLTFNNFTNSIQFSAYSVQLAFPIIFVVIKSLRTRKQPQMKYHNTFYV